MTLPVQRVDEHAVVDRFYAAWNGHDTSALVGLFGSNGIYADPLTRVALSGAGLADHFKRTLSVIGDLRMLVTRTINDDGAAAVSWRIEGTWNGTLADLTAQGVAVQLEGVDVLELGGAGLVRVQRSFDERALAVALGLQTIVEPYADGNMTFGYSLRSWVSKEKPQALGMTWILARDEAERLEIRARARAIIAHFSDAPGFIGIVTGFAGLHGFTLTAWESEQALRDATQSGAHRDTMHAFREHGLSGGVFTSVWQPLRLNRMWTRCPLGHPNDATRAGGTCEICGQPLPEPEPYV